MDCSRRPLLVPDAENPPNADDPASEALVRSLLLDRTGSRLPTAYARGMSGWVIRKHIDDVPPVPWANGAGTTREIVGYAESAMLSPGLAPWRLSIALLERPGAFSPLRSIDRTFLLVGGDAALSIDGEVRDLAHGDVVRFTGDQDVALASVTPGCHAVNLMVEQGETAGADAPRLVHGLDEKSTFAVALSSTPHVAPFDLLALAAGPGQRVELPADLASLIL